MTAQETTISRDEAVGVILWSGGLFVGVEFTKRSTGETRRMVCRTGVKAHLKGGEKAYDPVEKGLMTVFDVHKGEYRAIPVEGLTRIKVNGTWHAVVSGEQS